MTNQEAKEKFIKAQRELFFFQNDNQEYTHRLKALEDAAKVAEDNMRGIVSAEEKDAEIPELSIKFVYSKPYRKWIDYKVASVLVGPEKIRELDEITEFEAKIDVEAFRDKIRTGKFHEDAMGAFREEAMSPRVMKIKLK